MLQIYLKFVAQETKKRLNISHLAFKSVVTEPAAEHPVPFPRLPSKRFKFFLVHPGFD